MIDSKNNVSGHQGNASYVKNVRTKRLKQRAELLNEKGRGKVWQRVDKRREVS